MTIKNTTKNLRQKSSPLQKKKKQMYWFKKYKYKMGEKEALKILKNNKNIEKHDKCSKRSKHY